MEIDGFPVPPGCEILGRMVRKEAHYGQFEGGRIFIIQSVGYRAWMDEAEVCRQAFIGMYPSDPRYEPLSRRMETANTNAERCRNWRKE